jgi:hypothetical protein
VTSNDTATPTPSPTRDQVIAALGHTRERGDLHPNWDSVLVRLRQAAERHTALRAARELLERERQALTGKTGTDPLEARPSSGMAVYDAIAKVGELETEALCRYVCLGQAALELVAAGATPASWHEPLPGEEPRRDPLTNRPDLPVPGPELEELCVPKALTQAPGVDLLEMALRQFDALETADQEYEDLFGCNEHCAELEDGCSGGPHVPEHLIEQEAALLEELDREPDYVAGYADAVAWTLTHGLRDRLRAPIDTDT